MRKSALWNLLTNDSKMHPYGMILCDELSRKKLTLKKESRTFKGLSYVKCGETMYLGSVSGRPFLYDGGKKKEIADDLSRFPKTSDLTDFAREFSFAPDVILKAEFEEEALKIGEAVFPCEVRKAGDKWYLLLFRGKKNLILLDASRFLLYGFVDGSFIQGYLEV